MSRARRALLFLLVALAPMTAQAHAPDARRGAGHRWSPLERDLHRAHAHAQAAEGGLSSVSGELAGSPEAGWQVRVKVDGRSLRVAGPRWMERVTRSDAFLAVNRYPGIRFESAVFSDPVLRQGGTVRRRADACAVLRGQSASGCYLPRATNRVAIATSTYSGTISRKTSE